ncbi:type II toxin-antitoxin system VapC family toxin [soil metagenome]
MNCLLDTCTFLWLTDRTENLSTTARSLLEDSANTLVLSQVTSLEIQIKYSRGKLPLALPPEDFMRDAIQKHGLSYLQITDDHIWAKGKLPLLHSDPFDRLLIAQASHEGMMIVTPDRQIKNYPIRVIW